jgi:phosphopantothenoylcysteine decarboxylase/phosphopantothenate--cysteine ligase
MHFLITAGGTREYIDPVRFISNASSGKMGYCLAQAAIEAGHKVTLITAMENPKLEIRNPKLKKVKIESAAEMFEAVKKYFPMCDCLIMAAAVADYTPVKYSKTKIKKGKKGLSIKLKPTADILKWAGAHKTGSRVTGHGSRVVVGFALEDKNLRANAEKKLKDKNLDMIIANLPAAIGKDMACFYIKTATSRWQKFPSEKKQSLAGKIISIVEQMAAK